jgi:hypothetical protein
MFPAKRLEKINIDFRGPHSAELFEASYVKPTEYQHTVVGVGESHAVAAVRALSHLRNLGLGAAFLEIEGMVQKSLPTNANAIATPQADINIYCVLSFNLEDVT